MNEPTELNKNGITRISQNATQQRSHYHYHLPLLCRAVHIQGFATLDATGTVPLRRRILCLHGKVCPRQCYVVIIITIGPMIGLVQNRGCREPQQNAVQSSWREIQILARFVINIPLSYEIACELDLVISINLFHATLQVRNLCADKQSGCPA